MLLILMQVPARAAEDSLARFTVSEIRVVGLERVSEGTVYNYLPVNPGDEMTPTKLREALRALYATGFFRTVELRRDGNALVVVVTERPSIDSFEIKGNKDIKTEDLTKSLRNVGLAQGKTFDRSVLEDVKGYLIDQYFSRGKYGVTVDTKVQDEPGNRVNIEIDIDEGERAKIRQISIVGNTKFKEADILDSFELHTPQWNSWYKQNDRYSRESLQGDLEKLKSFYQDRGYANFAVESAQVTISPDKDDMFITISIHEGDIYKIADDAKIAGNTIVPLPVLQQLVEVKKGQIYSQQAISDTQKAIENRLGQDGYAFAKVDPVEKTDDEKKEAAVTFFVDPGKRVYVRHISFEGIERTQDVVLRREVTQLEGAWVSNISLDLSKQRIQRLPYIESVDYEKTKVEGTDDLVDVKYKIKEGPSATLSGGIGYSEGTSFSLNGSLADSNFLGTGQRLAIELNAGHYAQVYSFSHTTPYITADGISRTTNLSYTRQTQLTASYSDFSTKTALAGLDYGWPVSLWQSVHLSGTLERVEFATDSSTSNQIWEWARDNGGTTYLLANGNSYIRGTISNLLELGASWSYDNRNNALFATYGTLQSFNLTSTLPGNGLEYMTASYRFQHYFRIPVPLLDKVPLRISSTLGYGRAFGNTSSMPPNRLWFVGGPDSVRGFKDSTLGPRDSIGNPYGGDTAIYGTAEAIMPTPTKWQTSARISLFYDFGQAFYLGNTLFRNKDGTVADTSLDLRRLRSSAGISLEWLAPMGLFRFSYAVPLSWQRATTKYYGDERERFQFSVGSAF
ncbi:MAG TPA: outer membrane protein assembly factor BamA [Steroidobacteraceae bacterium]|nr:outer membrane protein assembly factor BamA [Steroidobacteraceae bacterium]